MDDKNRKLSYQQLLNLFFFGDEDNFGEKKLSKTPLLKEKHLLKVQKFLANLFYTEQDGLYVVSGRIFGMFPETDFFQERNILPVISELFSKRNIEIDKIAECLRCYYGNELIEYDILAYGSKFAIVINLYASLEMEDIDDLIADLHEFKLHFREFSNLFVTGALAAAEVSPEVAKYAFRNGLYVIVKSGKTIKLMNRKNFKPRVW